MSEKLYCVYMHTNKINGKKYVGITSIKPEKRWNSGFGYVKNEHFYSAIKKYGWENFEHKVLCGDLSLQDACDIERYLIKYYNLQDYNFGYNIMAGGQFCEIAESTKKKMSESRKGRKFSDEQKQHMSESRKKRQSPNKGKHLSEDWKRSLSRSMKGREISKEQHEHSIQNNPNVKSVICNGIEYDTIVDCAKFYGVNPNTMNSWLNGRYAMPEKFFLLGLKFKNEDVEYIKTSKKFLVFYDGIMYNSIQDCANVIGIDQKTLKKWLFHNEEIPENMKSSELRLSICWNYKIKQK